MQTRAVTLACCLHACSSRMSKAAQGCEEQLKDVKSSSRMSKAAQGCQKHASMSKALKDVKSSSRMSKALKDVNKQLKNVNKQLKDVKSIFIMLKMGAVKVYNGRRQES